MKKPEDAKALKGRSGLARWGRALGCSVDGFAAAWRDEAAFREECVIGAAALAAALALPFAAGVKLLLAAGILLVLIVEALNSAVEAAIDRIGTDIHPLSKKAKDLGSLAVLLAIGLNVLLWGWALATLF